MLVVHFSLKIAFLIRNGILFVNNAKINNSANDSWLRVDKNRFLLFLLFYIDFIIMKMKEIRKKFFCLKVKLTTQAILFNLRLLSQYHKE